MEYKHEPSLSPLARKLRREMTKEERHLWYDFLRGYPAKFLRQKILGKYIVDFYCPGAKLVIELDGSQHYEGENLEKDLERTAFLKGYDLEILRFPNNAIWENFPGVCEEIHRITQQRLGLFQKK